MSSYIKVGFRGYDLEIEILYYSTADAGVTSGPAENCYPPEDEEVDWKIKEDDNLASALIYESDTLHGELTTAILETIHREQIAQLEEEGDYRYEAMKDREYD